MAMYTAGLRHHSLAQSKEITIIGTLTQAKRAATQAFGDGFADHEIVIVDERGYIIASRTIGNRRWVQREDPA